MRRVVITGMGIVSSIGNNIAEVLDSLRSARSGIVRAEDYARLGFRCQVHGAPTLDPETCLDRRAMRFHALGSGWAHVAMDQAIADAGLGPDEVSHERTGIIVGIRRSLDENNRRIGRSDAQQGAETGRPFRRAQSHVVDGARRRSPPGSRSKASIIRSPRPVPPPIIASAMPMRPSPMASRI